MKNILKKYGLSFFAVVVLLFVQAYCDLALPDYTSKIINVGIQQKGVESEIIDKMTDKTYANINSLTSVDLSKYYEKVSKTDANIKKYSYLKDGDVYVLKGELSEDDKKSILDSTIIYSFLLNNDAIKQMGIDINPTTIEYYTKSDTNNFDEYLTSFNNLDESMKKQYAISFISSEYERLGINLKDLQMNYLFKSGTKMIVLSLFIMVVIIATTYISGRLAGMVAYDLREKVVRKVMSFSKSEFNEFETKKMNLNFVCMTEYDATMPNVKVAFKPEKLTNTFGEYISKLGMKQLRIAETEKYAHVTFFFNGGEEKQYEGEDRILIPSPKVETYDMKPEMSAYEVTEKVVEAINSEKYDSIILNFANPDMVGHTGNQEAAEKAIEAVDECVGKIVDALSKHNGKALITADHGNSEQMIDYKTGEPFTSHTTNPVPLILYGMDDVKLKNGKLADLAPTMLDMMGLEKPAEMTGESLLVRE